MRRQGSLVVLALALLAVGACIGSGSGNLVTESRDVGPFDSIDASSGVNVELTVQPGADHSVLVTMDDNLLDNLETTVVGSTLVISIDGVVNIFGSGRVVEVTMPALVEVNVSGGADIRGNGSIDSYSLSASGGSNTDFENLEAIEVQVEVSGGADATVHASSSVEGNASGGSNLTIVGDPDRVLVESSGGADVDLER